MGQLVPGQGVLQALRPAKGPRSRTRGVQTVIRRSTDNQRSEVLVPKPWGSCHSDSQDLLACAQVLTCKPRTNIPLTIAFSRQ